MSHIYVVYICELGNEEGKIIKAERIHSYTSFRSVYDVLLRYHDRLSCCIFNDKVLPSVPTYTEVEAHVEQEGHMRKIFTFGDIHEDDYQIVFAVGKSLLEP